jgi:hypothetical protein
MPIAPIPRGGTLSFTISGIPSTDTSGPLVAGGLALALIAAAVVFGRRPRASGKSGADPADARDKLIERRESTFAELVDLEKTSRESGGAAPPDRRRQIVSRLEQIYRDLAALDERRAA